MVTKLDLEANKVTRGDGGMKRADSHPSGNCEHSAMYSCDGGEEPEVASAYPANAAAAVLRPE